MAGGDMIFLEGNATTPSALPVYAKVSVTSGFASAFSDPIVDRLYKEALQEFRPKQRAIITKKLAYRHCQQAPLINVYSRSSITGLSKRINFRPQYGEDYWTEYAQIKPT